jgi:hypothetical protein
MKHRAMLLASESLPGKNLKVPWVSSVLAQSLLRTLTVVLILGVCAGSVLMLTSVLTTERFFFLFMGFFVTLGSLMSYILLQRLQRSLDA